MYLHDPLCTSKTGTLKYLCVGYCTTCQKIAQCNKDYLQINRMNFYISNL